MMASRRMISADIFEDEFVASLNYFERLLWIGLFSSVADDQGRMVDNAALIRARVFLYDTVTDDQVERTLCKLHKAGKIARYVVVSKQLIQVVKWWEYQTPSWAAPSKYPTPLEWQDRVKYHATGNKIIMKDWDKIGGYVVGYVSGQDSAIEERRGEERKGEERNAPPPAFCPSKTDPSAEVFKTYSDNIGMLTKITSDALDADIQDYTDVWVIEAIKEAVRNEARSLAYVEGILKRWKRDGFRVDTRKSSNSNSVNQQPMTEERFRRENPL